MSFVHGLMVATWAPMAIGRFTSDSINRHIGSAKLVRTGAPGAAIGLGLGLVLAPLSVIVGSISSTKGDP